MDENIRETIVEALRAHRGDDLHRAQLTFRGRTDEEMQEEYGSSGQTCAEVLEGYSAHDRKVLEALKWVDNLD